MKIQKKQTKLISFMYAMGLLGILVCTSPSQAHFYCQEKEAVDSDGQNVKECRYPLVDKYGKMVFYVEVQTFDKKVEVQTSGKDSQEVTVKKRSLEDGIVDGRVLVDPVYEYLVSEADISKPLPSTEDYIGRVIKTDGRYYDLYDKKQDVYNQIATRKKIQQTQKALDACNASTPTSICSFGNEWVPSTAFSDKQPLVDNLKTQLASERQQMQDLRNNNPKATTGYSGGGRRKPTEIRTGSMVIPSSGSNRPPTEGEISALPTASPAFSVMQVNNQNMATMKDAAAPSK